MACSRRFFVGASLAALAAGCPSLSQAWTHGSSNLGFNGGRSQVNLNFGVLGGDYPFLNNILNCGSLSLGDNSGSPSPADLDANGYPLNGSNAIVSHGGVFLVGFLPSIANGGSNYVVKVTGKGTFSSYGSIVTANITGITSGASTVVTVGAGHDFRVGMVAPIAGVVAGSGNMASVLNGNGPFTITAISSTTITLNVATTGTWASGGTAAYGSFTCTNATSRIVLDMTGAPTQGDCVNMSIAISATDAVTPITNIAMVRQGSEEARYDAGQIFGIDFLTKLQSAKFGVIRFLNSMNTNISNVTTWSTRTPQGYISYSATQAVNSIYAGTATGTALDYAGTLGSGAPTDKQQVTTAFPCRAVTVSSGANATVSLTGHGYSVGDAFNLFGDHSSVAPTGMPFLDPATNVTRNYFIIAAGFGANSFQFATTQGGAAVTTSSTGSGSLYVQKTVVDSTVTFTNGSSTIGWTGHQLGVNDPVSFTVSGGALPSNFNSNGGIYYVKTVINANSITVAATAGGTTIVAASAPSGTASGVRLLTYNLNGTGAKPILASGAGAPTVAGNNIQRARYFGTSITYGTMTYDALLGAWLAYGAQDGFGTQFISSYWPPETCFALCNHPMIRAHPWFPSPSLVLNGSTGITDFMPSLAAYCRDNQPSWMLPRFEVHNELWNTVFFATGMAMAHASAYKFNGTWTVDGVDEYCGKVASVLGQAINNVYGGTVGAKYQMVVGVWTTVMDSTIDANSHDSRLTSAQYAAQSASPQPPYTRTAASQWATHVCCAQYITPTDYGTGTESTLSAAFNGTEFIGSISGSTLTVSSVGVGALATGQTLFGSGITSVVTITGGSGTTWTLSSSAFNLSSRPFFTGTDMTAPGSYLDSLAGASATYNLAYTAAIYGFIFAWAQKFTNNASNKLKMNGYEGGYSPNFTSNGASQVDLLRNAGALVTSSGSFAAGAYTVTMTNYTNFANAGGEFPACFQFTGRSPVDNAWSVLNDLYQTPLPPQWNAIVGYNA